LVSLWRKVGALENSLWKSHGIVNGVALVGNSSGGTPGASVALGVAIIIISEGGAVLFIIRAIIDIINWLFEYFLNLLSIKFRALEDSSWKSLSVFNGVASISNSSGRAP